MTRIVRTTYRYERPPRKRKAVALEVLLPASGREFPTRPRPPWAPVKLAPGELERKPVIATAEEAAMRVIACLAVYLISFAAHAAQSQPASEPQSYCVNLSADFYPYSGEPCKSGYQLGPGNCRNASGHMVAVTRDQCLKMAGTVELPIEQGVPPPPYTQPGAVPK